MKKQESITISSLTIFQIMNLSEKEVKMFERSIFPEKDRDKLKKYISWIRNLRSSLRKN